MVGPGSDERTKGKEEPGENRAARQAERRSEPRYPVDEESVLIVVGNGGPQPARLIELSQEGCRLHVEEPVAARVRAPLEVFFKAKGAAFRFHGILEWTNGRNLFGIRLVNVDPQRMVQLANLICGLEKDPESQK